MICRFYQCNDDFFLSKQHFCSVTLFAFYKSQSRLAEPGLNSSVCQARESALCAALQFYRSPLLILRTRAYVMTTFCHPQRSPLHMDAACPAGRQRVTFVSGAPRPSPPPSRPGGLGYRGVLKPGAAPAEKATPNAARRRARPGEGCGVICPGLSIFGTWIGSANWCVCCASSVPVCSIQTRTDGACKGNSPWFTFCDGSFYNAIETGFIDTGHARHWLA